MQLGYSQFESAYGAAAFVVPKTLRFCKACRKDTPHEILVTDLGVKRLCVPCLEADLNYELDRD